MTRHIAIFAGTGSGKTVLLRRILEEAALLGVPAIVLDTNNDLARLGQPWPTVPRLSATETRARRSAITGASKSSSGRLALREAAP